MSPPRPLDGILVVSIEQAIAAPYCSRLLADLGARVIKVERPGAGDFARAYDTRVRGQSSHFVWTNRSKESLSLDLKSQAAMTCLTELMRRADVFIQNLAPGAAVRLGLSPSALHADNPSLITCSISGYGDAGPDADRKAYDLLIQAEAGFLSVTGTADHPAKAGISVADIAAGVSAHSAILAALLNRAKTGRGDHIDISMLEAMAEWMGFPMYFAYDDAAPPPRAGAGHATIFPYGPFETANGQVLFGIQNDREWQVFCRLVLDRPDMADDNRFIGNAARAEHRAMIQPVIDTRFAALPSETILALLDQAGIATARVNDMHGLWRHPQLAARNRWQQVESPAGPIDTLRPVTGEAWQPRMDPVPAVGQHTMAILEELDLDRETREAIMMSQQEDRSHG